MAIGLNISDLNNSNVSKILDKMSLISSLKYLDLLGSLDKILSNELDLDIIMKQVINMKYLEKINDIPK